MESDLEREIVTDPRSPAARDALRCLMRLRGEGRPVEAIAAGLKEETGIELSPAAVDRILRAVAGPAPKQSGGDPDYFSGYLGGG